MSESNTQMTVRKPQPMAVAARKATMNAIVDGLMPRITKLKTVSPERFAQIVLVEAGRNPKLAECTGATLSACLMLCAELGLEPSGPRGHAYLIPRNTKVKHPDGPDTYEMQCTLLVGYKGLAELARRSGQITRLNAQVVYQDELDRKLWRASLEPAQIVHEYALDIDRSDDKLVAAYAVAEMSDGSKAQVILSWSQIEARRKRGKAGDSSPWSSDYAAMARKTVLRALLTGGLVPMGDPAEKALEADADAIDTTADEVPLVVTQQLGPDPSQVVDVRSLPPRQPRPEPEAQPQPEPPAGALL